MACAARIATILIACALGLGLMLSGCAALSAPATQTEPAATRNAPAGSKLAAAQATHEYPSRAPRQSASGSISPVQAITIFATAYINWDAGNVAADMAVLASASIGQARSAMQLAAAQTAGDYELKRGGIANRGTVEAVAPLTGQRDQFVVVTREATTATATNAYQGLRPAWHVTIASVERLGPGQWVISGWQPEG
ncbi:MAG: hypothetical protein M3Z06_04225 [Actinomycetota bacterium]|nr:hypothetical protein [Actinomycetota bacterium]